jgi:ribosomal protein L35AE/L33A
MFNNPAEIKQYALAGHATLTLSSQRTGNRYTYKISRAKDDDGQPKDLWFVGLLAGPDNETSYQYMGVLNGSFKLTSKSRKVKSHSMRKSRSNETGSADAIAASYVGEWICYRIRAARLAYRGKLSRIAVANKVARRFELDKVSFGYRDSGHMLYQASRASQEVLR